MSGLEVTMMKRIGELNAEVKYLQDKVERLTAEVSYDKRVQLHVDKLAAEFTQCEVERLKAEVERLKSHSFTSDELASMKAETELLHAKFKRDLFNQVTEENERLRKAGEWQPIETAPKDGTWVLLWWKETPTGSECFDEWSPEQAVGKWHYDCWMRCSEYSVGGTPTAWQSLPNPPAKEGKQS